jgi:hypothetical protein
MPEACPSPTVTARLALTNCHGFMARPFMNSASGVRPPWLPEAGVCRAGSDRSHMEDQMVGADAVETAAVPQSQRCRRVVGGLINERAA